MSTEQFTKNLTEKFEIARKRMEEAKAVLQAEGKVLFQEMCKDIFERYPEVSAISWTQFTPYFNDGDACTFSVNDPYFYAKEEDETDGVDPDDYDEEPLNGHRELHGTWWYGDKEAPVTLKTCKEFGRFIQGNEEIMQDMFGDHCRVVITREGVDIEDYSHD